jgi:hypothetical protein
MNWRCETPVAGAIAARSAGARLERLCQQGACLQLTSLLNRALPRETAGKR